MPVWGWSRQRGAAPTMGRAREALSATPRTSSDGAVEEMLAADAEASSDTETIRVVSADEAVRSLQAWATALRQCGDEECEALARLAQTATSGALKDVHGTDGWTPLKVAAYDGRQQMVQALLECGAWRELPKQQPARSEEPPERSLEGCGPHPWLCLFPSPQRRQRQRSSVQMSTATATVTTDPDKFTAAATAVPTAPYLAAQQGHTEVVRQLALFVPPEQPDRRVDVDVASAVGWTPLFIAARHGHVSTCRQLLLLGADPRRRDVDEWTPLHVAVSNNQPDVVRLLVSEGGIVPRYVRAKHSWTPMHSAAQHGHWPMLRLLLELDCDANVETGDGWTPLHSAVKNGHLHVVKELVQSGGAAPDAAKRNGWTALHTAARNNRLAIARWLLQEANASPRRADSHGRSALHVAAANGHAALCRLLAHTEPSLLTMRTRDGATALEVAYEMRHWDLCLYLLRLGAPLASGQRAARMRCHLMHYLVTRWWERARVPLPDMITPEAAASLPPDTDAAIVATVACVRQLVSLGVDVNVRRRSRGNRTPLHTAAAMSHADGVRALMLAVGGGEQGALALEAPLHDAGAAGQTALHLACAQAHTDVGTATVAALLEAGASVWARDRQRRTPLHVAAANGARDSALHRLVEHGAPQGDLVAARDVRGATPIDVAREAGQRAAHATLTSLLGARRASRSAPARGMERGVGYDALTTATSSAPLDPANTDQHPYAATPATTAATSAADESIHSVDVSGESGVGGVEGVPGSSRSSHSSHSTWNTFSEASAPPYSYGGAIADSEPGDKPEQLLRFRWSATPRSSPASISSVTASTWSSSLPPGYPPSGSRCAPSPSPRYDASPWASMPARRSPSSALPPPSHAPAQQPRRGLGHAECAVCSDAGPHVLWTVYNCGHCTCERCARRLFECPMCRVRITSRIRLYL